MNAKACCSNRARVRRGRDLAQRTLPGEHRQSVDRGPDRVFEPFTAAGIEHARVDQFVERGAQEAERRGVGPGRFGRGGAQGVRMLSRLGEGGGEQSRLLAGEVQVCRADRAEPCPRRRRLCAGTGNPGDARGHAVGQLAHRRGADGGEQGVPVGEIAFIGFLAGQLFAGPAAADDVLFEVAVIHHTQCGTGLLADPGFRHGAAAATGVPETVLETEAVTDPRASVVRDVERLLASPRLPDQRLRARVRRGDRAGDLRARCSAG